MKKLQSTDDVGTHKIATCAKCGFRISVEAIRFRGIGPFEEAGRKLR